MFTGIIQQMGAISAVQDRGTDRTISIHQPEIAQCLFIGASVAINGVCQTVTELSQEQFSVEAMAETQRVTTLGKFKPGERVNLETPIAAGAPMGGHFVQGHVDGVGTLVSREAIGEAEKFVFSMPRQLAAELVAKGSIAVDGISLTVGPDLTEDRFEVYLIPHTLAVTTLGAKRTGDSVNLETDILAKYVLRALRGSRTDGVSWDKLAATGFLPKQEGQTDV